MGSSRETPPESWVERYAGGVVVDMERVQVRVASAVVSDHKKFDALALSRPHAPHQSSPHAQAACGFR